MHATEDPFLLNLKVSIILSQFKRNLLKQCFSPLLTRSSKTKNPTHMSVGLAPYSLHINVHINVCLLHSLYSKDYTLKSWLISYFPPYSDLNCFYSSRHSNCSSAMKCFCRLCGGVMSLGLRPKPHAAVLNGMSKYNAT